MLDSKIKIGTLDRTILIYQKNITINEFNEEEIDGWAFYKKKFAQVQNYRFGDEVVEADKITFVNRLMFYVRYDASLTVEMRILFDGKIYEIISILEPQETRKSKLEIVGQFLEGETT